MKICKKNESGHVLRLDVPHFFHREDSSVVDHYSYMINHKLSQQHDPFWRNWTPEVFVHLKCEFCGEEEHIYLPINYLQTVMHDEDFAMQWTSFKRIQVKYGNEIFLDEVIQLN